jgi:hypothetical protein
MEAAFMVLPIGDPTAPLIERYTSSNLPPNNLIGQYVAQQALFSGQHMPMAFMQDTSLFSKIPTTPAQHTEPLNMAAATEISPYDQEAVPESVRPQRPLQAVGTRAEQAPKLSLPPIQLRRHPVHAMPFGERLRSGFRHKRAIILGSAIMAIAAGVGAAGFAPSTSEVPSAIAPETAHLQAKRIVLQSAVYLGQSATCAPELTVMANYIDQQTANAVDLAQLYPSASEYRAAATIAAQYNVPCAGPNQSSATVGGETVYSDALLGYTFDVDNLCVLDNRLAVQNDILDQPKGPVRTHDAQDLQALFAQADADCP